MFKNSKKRKSFRQTLAWMLSLAMILSNLTGFQVSATTVSSGDASAVKEYVLNASDLTTFDKEAKADGEEEIAGTDNYFTILWGAKSAVNDNSKTFADGFAATKRINFGATSTASAYAVKFTTSDAATVKVWWACGGDGRQVSVYDSNKTVIAATALESVKNTMYISEITVAEAGTYLLGGLEGNNYLYKISVTEGAQAAEPTTAPTEEPTEAPTVEPTEEPTAAPTEEPTAEPTEEPVATQIPAVAYDPTKIDVWDFGAEQLDTEKYNNMLNADVMNAWYDSSVAPGTKGVNLATCSVADADGKVLFTFNDGGYPTTHRLRTMNADVTRYDDKSKSLDGVTYNGFIYSNKAASADVYVGFDLSAGETFTAIVASNGTAADYVVEAPSGAKTTYTNIVEGSDPAVLTFYPTEDGLHKIYTSKEKLVICRAYVAPAIEVEVTGNATAPASLTDYEVIFTNNQSQQTTTAKVENGKYATTLYAGFDYTLSLGNADGYVISEGANISLADGVTAAQADITIVAVEKFTITGSLVGLPEEVAANLTLEFVSDEIFVPEVTITGTSYTTELESGIEYTVKESGINDYSLVAPKTAKITEAGALDITFEKKPVYDVAIAPEGATVGDLANATFTFTNLNEEGYVYTFTGAENIQLRDGVYDVKVTNCAPFVQKLTSNLKVEGAAVTKTIGFESNITVWEFTAADFAEGGFTGGAGNYNGLAFTNASNNKNTYLYSGAGTVSVPVKGDCKIAVSACYQYSFYFENETESSVGVKTNSTSQIDTFTYDYKGEAGTVDITVLGGSYFTKIEIIESAEFKDTVTVGPEGDFQTINDALAAVKKMDRPNNERVTISITPGNYEEMLVIDIPNVTLKNASATPSIELKNKGVDIDENAVRITHYYGHGYTYYSMGSDCKYDEEILAVNKENGYASFENPGSGTTAGSYWNATVVINANGVEAEGIIFENSFNQYVSEKAANDVIVAQASAKEGSVPRADMNAGDITVQDKKYVERAAALAIYNNCKEVSFDNCKFIGRQDTLYGGTDVTAAFYDCAIYGGTDYIFGAMNAVFAKCDLVFNTSEDKNDVGYITAAQTKSGRGMLMYNCNVTSTVPGVDTASEYTSKAGYLGRPWQAGTGEAVFYYTVIDATDTNWYEASPSMIHAAGWLSTLSGESAMSAEYGTYEMAKGVDNQASRAAWATTLTGDTAVLADGTDITKAEDALAAFLGDWDAFAGKDMEIAVPTDKVDNAPVEDDDDASATLEFVLETSALTAFAQGAKADGDEEKAGTEDYFTLIYSAKSKIDGSNKTWDDGYASGQRVNFGGKVALEKNAVKFTTSNPATVKIWWACGGDGRQMAILNAAGEQVAVTTDAAVKNAPYVSTIELAEAGTYYLGGDTNNNYIFKVLVTEEKPAEPIVSTLDTAADLTAFAAGAKADGDEEKAGTEDYFTIIYSAKSKVDSSSKTWEDGYTSGQRLNLGGKVALEKNAVKFTTTNPSTVKIWWACGGDGRQMAILNAAGEQVAVTTDAAVKNAPYISTIELAEAGTYYLGGDTNNNYIFKVEVTETPGGAVKPPRADWSTVEAPALVSAEQVTTADNTIEVNVNANVGYDGADKITVTMTDEAGNVIATKNSSKESTEHTVTFNPTASGTYTFAVVAIREGEADKAGAETKAVNFVLKLEAPSITSATSLGAQADGTVSVEICWDAVTEATGYEVSVKDTEIKATTEGTSYVVTGLAANQEYTFIVKALRGEEASAEATIVAKATAESQLKWSFSAFGSGVDTKNNGYEGNANDGSVRVYSNGGKGKIVPNTTDGLAFYYTEINPETTNFTLTATAKVNNWKLSNGQEGFGLMAADRVGKNGDSSTFWNNSYMASVTKVEYFWDGEKVSDSGSKISMKLGVGSQEKKGVTLDNINEALSLDDMSLFSTKMTTLETSCAALGAGTYNIVGGYTGTEPTGTVENAGTEFKLTIQKNNTGYFVSYTNEAGETVTNKYYGTDVLNYLDSDSVYVGFYASRNADITFEDINFTTIDPKDDAPAEERPVTLVTPNFFIESATTANSADYEMVYYGNADGQLVITDEAGNVILDKAVTAKTKVRQMVKLAEGKNNFNVTMTPDADYQPSEYEKLSSYEAVSFTHMVEYRNNVQTVVYVGPNGAANGAGTKESPLDIYTAVKWAMPGQQILLMEGTYNLSSTVTMERGMDGTADKMIYLMADPDAATRPVLDFGKKCAGMVVGADYWYLQGFDVTQSADAQKGLQISGSNNVVDQVNAYRNGNTGIQISRFKSTDLWEDWPSNNLILNCTSYLNADKGYEDADGFAAKLTIADGNVFDGCIAAYNADDGWDLFAKMETGAIGKVVIKNSVAFKNGYVVDDAGNEVNAGNGNGFKMGGDSITGYHELINSYAFGNKAKGFDSNSCPDIQVKNSIAFNNLSYNVAFYTNNAINTDYAATGIISYKTASGEAENIKPKGTQDTSKIYGTTNFYFDGSQSANSDGTKVSDDWFVSLDMDSAVKGGITRNADGTINMGDFLKLTDKAPAGVGADGQGTPSKDIEINEPVQTPAPTQAPTVAPTQAPTAAPTQAPTAEPTVAPTQAPVAPTPTPSVGEIVAGAIEDLINAGAEAANDILNAKTPEDLKEAINSFVNTVIDIFKNLPVINVSTAMSLANAEAAIAARGASIKVDDGDAKVKVNKVSNGLFSVPEGGKFEVKDTVLSQEQKNAAMKSGISDGQLKNAVPMEMNLFDKNNNSVKPVVPMVVSFDLPKEFAGKDVKLLHYTEGGVEVIDVEENGNSGSAVVSSFSTFALVAVDVTKAPKTSDIVVPQVYVPAMSADSSSSILPWICIMVAALAGGAAVITGASFFRKDEEE